MGALPRGYRRLPTGRIQWRAKVNGRYLKGSADTLAEARVDRARAQLDAGSGSDRDEVMTVAELLAIDTEERTNAATTKARRASALGKVPDEFTALPVVAVNARAVDQLWRRLKADGVGAHTCGKIQQAMSVAWRRALAWELVESNPWQVVTPPPKPPSAEVNPPTPEQVAALVAASPLWLSTWVKVAAVAGPRPGELCALRWSSIDSARSTIRIGPSIDKFGNETDGKIGRGGHRVIALPLPVMRALTQLEADDDRVFHVHGLPRRPQSVRQELYRVCDRLDVDRVTPYSLRHFAASQAIAAGVPIPEVAAMLGDNPATVMKTYAHHIPRDSSAASAVADALGWS